MGIRLAQMWNVPRLFHYSLDHFERQFKAEKIHPAVVLAIARENGIPSLIRPAIEALAEPTASLHSWCCDVEVLRYVQVGEIGAIARMKERLYNARVAILDVPLVTHRTSCTDSVSCEIVWDAYWNAKVGRKARRLYDGSVAHQLWFIRSSDVLGAKVPGMDLACLAATIDKVGSNLCWFSDRQIIEGAVRHLMIPERFPDWCGVNSDVRN